MDRITGLLKLIAGMITAVFSVMVVLSSLGIILIGMFFDDGAAVDEKIYRDVIGFIVGSIIVWVVIFVLRDSQAWIREGWSTLWGRWGGFSDEKTNQVIREFQKGTIQQPPRN